MVKLCDFGFARMMSPGDNYTDYVATRLAFVTLIFYYLRNTKDVFYTYRSILELQQVSKNITNEIHPVILCVWISTT